jgi:hypothetical protein
VNAGEWWPSWICTCFAFHWPFVKSSVALVRRKVWNPSQLSAHLFALPRLSRNATLAEPSLDRRRLQHARHHVRRVEVAAGLPRCELAGRGATDRERL